MNKRSIVVYLILLFLLAWTVQSPLHALEVGFLASCYTAIEIDKATALRLYAILLGRRNINGVPSER